MSSSLLTRAANVGGASVRHLRAVLWPITQTSVAAGLSWYIARQLLAEPQPIFAPITAVVCLSATNLSRARRAGQMIVGVALGIFLGDQVVAVLGRGAVAIAIAVLFSLCIAVLIERAIFAQGVTFISQTASADRTAVGGLSSDGEAEGAQLLAPFLGDLVRAPRWIPDPVDPDVVDQATTHQRAA
jgi:Fusaric acid resistance protein-like